MGNLSDYMLLWIGFIAGSIVMTIALSIIKSNKESCSRCEEIKKEEITPVKKRTRKVKNNLKSN